jgi:hypothetical protein
LKGLEAALKVYKSRSGIEAMFKDCKSGGYNLEESKACVERLTNLVLLIAIAYTCAGLQGQLIKSSGQQKYIGRLKELNRMTRRHSNFWVGLYGQMWIAALETCSDWVKNLIPHSALKVSHPDNFEVKQAVVPEASGGWKGRGDDAIDCQPVPTAFVL